ncbi:carbon storage regulator CsrA [Clostridiaceae bacterium 35-E11]
MLILTRKTNESIIIDNQIEVKIISIEDGKVKLGISAPKDIEIHRKEVYLEIQEENKQAAIGNFDLKNLKSFLKK